MIHLQDVGVSEAACVWPQRSLNDPTAGVVISPPLSQPHRGIH